MLVKKTLSTCPICDKMVNADIIRRGDDLYITKECEEHGFFDTLYWVDSDLYEKVAKIVNGAECDSLHCVECTDHIRFSACLTIDLTKRCNLECPVCYANANEGGSDEPTREQIIQRLAAIRSKIKPNIVLSGGEPTLREDLPEIISGIIEKGYVPRVVTNGILLQDDEYVKALAESGLLSLIHI